MVLVRPQALAALHALGHLLCTRGLRVVFVQPLAAKPAITCLMGRVLLVNWVLIRALPGHQLARTAALVLLLL